MRFIVFLAVAAIGFAQESIDALAERARKTFDVPGIGVGGGERCRSPWRETLRVLSQFQRRRSSISALLQIGSFWNRDLRERSALSIAIYTARNRVYRINAK